jgi:hypothetical protein
MTVAKYRWPDNPAKFNGLTEINSVDVVQTGNRFNLICSDGEQINTKPLDRLLTEDEIRALIERGGS